MKYLICLLMLTGAVHASTVSCYTSENIITCGDQFTAIKFDNMTQVETPKGSLTIYNYDSGSSILVPAETGPSVKQDSNLLNSPSLDLLESQ